MKPTLVILAAGVGTRFGGAKQFEPVGPGGATIMEYSIFDALRAGFGRVIFVVRPESEERFRELTDPIEPHVVLGYAHQDLHGLPGGFAAHPQRSKPWGTGHALLAGADAVAEPFAVINADDFYGPSAFAELAQFLNETSPHARSYAMVAYRLRDTLPETGSVSRAICRLAEDGSLDDVMEITSIERGGEGGEYTDENGRRRFVDSDTLVSMNMWGFTPAVFDDLRDEFVGFLRACGGSMQAEFYLPAAVRGLLRRGRAHVTVLISRDAWCGMTNPRDKEPVAAMIRERVARGEYPEELWG